MRVSISFIIKKEGKTQGEGGRERTEGRRKKRRKERRYKEERNKKYKDVFFGTLS